MFFLCRSVAFPWGDNYTYYTHQAASPAVAAAAAACTYVAGQAIYPVEAKEDERTDDDGFNWRAFGRSAVETKK